MSDTSFRRFGGVCAILLAVCAFAYAALLYLDAGTPGISGRLGEILAMRGLNGTGNLLLAAVGLLTTVGASAVHGRFKENGRAWARWAAGLGLVGGAMAAAHGYGDFLRVPVLLAQWELGNEGRQLAISTFAGVPNAVDPRGLGTLLFVGLFALVFGRLMLADKSAPALLGQVGLVFGALSVVSFIAGLGAPDVLRTALTGVNIGIAGPVWWLLVGRELLRA